jgi:hypothetical protein
MAHRVIVTLSIRMLQKLITTTTTEEITYTQNAIAVVVLYSNSDKTCHTRNNQAGSLTNRAMVMLQQSIGAVLLLATLNPPRLKDKATGVPTSWVGLL